MNFQTKEVLISFFHFQNIIFSNKKKNLIFESDFFYFKVFSYLFNTNPPEFLPKFQVHSQ